MEALFPAPAREVTCRGCSGKSEWMDEAEDSKMPQEVPLMACFCLDLVATSFKHAFDCCFTVFTCV